MITEAVYWACKMYFIIAAPLLFIHAWFTNDYALFTNLTGIVSILFLISNIIWYGRGGH